MTRMTPNEETGSATIGMGGFQETEPLPIFSQIARFQTRINRLAELTSRALDLALAERGPVRINIPRDDSLGASKKPKRFLAKYQACEVA